jgi:predicted CoA-binding protein
MQENIESPASKFIAAKSFAVAGASRDRSKYGNKVFQALVTSGHTVYPLNPSAPEIEGHPTINRN